MWAAAYGQLSTVQLFLMHGAQVDARGPEGETALLLASAAGHHDVIRLLLNEGAAVNHTDDVSQTIFTVHRISKTINEYRLDSHSEIVLLLTYRTLSRHTSTVN